MSVFDIHDKSDHTKKLAFLDPSGIELVAFQLLGS